MPDGEENAGVIRAFDATSQTLTLALAAGGTLTGTLDSAAGVSCGDDDSALDDSADEEDPGDDEELYPEDDPSGDDAPEDEDATVVTASLAEEGDELDADDEEWPVWEDDGCGSDLLPGTVVRQADFEDGVFYALELVPAA